MTQSFAQTAEDWACLSAQLLGWRPSEFWQATPRELAIALRDPAQISAASGPSRDLIAQMMEREDHG